MKFITETDLRGSYNREKFTSYNLDSGVKLTPGAKQFLTDRGIQIITVEDSLLRQADPAKSGGHSDGSINWRCHKLLYMMQRISALFLVCGEQLLQKDVLLAQKVLELSGQFRRIQEHGRNASDVPDLECQECTGIKAALFSENTGDCFPITEFHVGLEKGSEIVILNHLRSSLREIEPAVLEICKECPDKDGECESPIRKVNQIINTLNLMICLCTGGKTCQRQ